MTSLFLAHPTGTIPDLTSDRYHVEITEHFRGYTVQLVHGYHNKPVRGFTYKYKDLIGLTRDWRLVEALDGEKGLK